MARSFKMAVVCSALLTLTLSCGDQSTAPLSDVPAPLDEIIDAAHGGGNLDFFFLPPLVADPSGNAAFDADAFDASLEPVIEICALDADGCAPTQPDMFPITYTMTDGPGSETVRVDADAEHYIVNWHTDAFALDPDATYRIRVLVAGTELGHADVDVAESGGELRNINTNEYVPLKDGRTLPIKFRIEQGAVFVVGTGGGTLVAEDGAVTLVILKRDAPIGITVQPATGYPDTSALVAGTAFDLGPEGAMFDPPATLTIQYDPAILPPNTYPRMHHLVDGVWQPVAGSTADRDAHTVSAPVAGFSNWAVLGTGVVLTVHVSGGQGQVRIPGAKLPDGTPLEPCTYNDITCAIDFPPDTVLTLEAETLGQDANFESWSGPGAPSTCTTDPTCVVTMDMDREVTATFSMPGLIGLSAYEAAFAMPQGGTGSPASTDITVSNIGDRDVHLEELETFYVQSVPEWLHTEITSLTVVSGSPETLTLSVVANPLPPGEYTAHVRLTDGFTTGIVEVTLTVSATTSYTYDGTGNEFGPLPLSVAAFTDDSGTDLYPVGPDTTYLFVLFDTGSDIVNISVADATLLNIGAASTTNPNQDTRVRMDGLAAINASTLIAPIGAHGTDGGAQAEVLGIRVGPASPPQRADRGATLIGAPVANAVLALIDNATTVSRGPYPFCGGCYAEGPNITFYMQTDVIPTPDLQLPLERFGSTAPALLDNATNGQKYFLNNVLFRNGVYAVMDDPAAAQPYRFWFDTGAPPTIISSRMAVALGLDLSAGGTFDCFQGTGKEGNEGYVIDQIEFAGTTTSGVGAYVINNASVCVDVRSEELRQRYPDPSVPGGVLLDAQIGANLFMHVPILFDGVNNKLGIVVP